MTLAAAFVAVLTACVLFVWSPIMDTREQAETQTGACILAGICAGALYLIHAP